MQPKIVKYMPTDEEQLYTDADKHGITVYHQSTSNFQAWVYEEGARLSQPDVSKLQSLTPLTLAITNFVECEQRTSFIAEVISKSDINRPEATSWTPLHYAASIGDAQTIKLLIQHKVQAFTPNKEFKFPIDLAGLNNHDESVKLLIDYSIQCFETLLLTYNENEYSKPFYLDKSVIDPALTAHQELFLCSPIYATKLLYWSARSK